MPDDKAVKEPETPQEEAAAIEEEYYVEEPNYDHLDPDAEDEEAVEDEPEEVAGESVEEPEERQFTNEQRAYGRMLGMTDEDVESFSGGPEGFDRMLNNIAASVGMDPATMAIQRDAKLYNEPEGKEDTVNEDQGGSDEMFRFSDPDSYDEEVVQLAEHTNSQLQQMRTQLDAMGEQNARLQADIAAREFDAICDTLPEEIYGRGRLNALTPEQSKSRMDLAQSVTREGIGYRERGEMLPPVEDIVRGSHFRLHGDQLRNHTLEAVSRKSKSQRSQTAAEPTSQEDFPLSSTERAIRAAASWHKDRGTDNMTDEELLG